MSFVSSARGKSGRFLKVWVVLRPSGKFSVGAHVYEQIWKNLASTEGASRNFSVPPLFRSLLRLLRRPTYFPAHTLTEPYGHSDGRSTLQWHLSCWCSALHRRGCLARVSPSLCRAAQSLSHLMWNFPLVPRQCRRCISWWSSFLGKNASFRLIIWSPQQDHISPGWRVEHPLNLHNSKVYSQTIYTLV